MIFDSIYNRKQYAGIHPGIDCLLELMKDYTPNNYPEGRVDVDGDALFMNFADYETHGSDTALLEAHKQYIDVMYMVEGSEIIYIKPTAEMRHITKPYDPEMEALLGQMESDTAAIRMEPGRFIILFPQDAHAPGCYVDEVQKVKKIIGKVRI